MSPILFWLGPIPITSFGFSSAVGTLLCYLAATHRAREEGLDTEVVVDLFLIVLICGFLGGRLMYVVTYPESVAGDPWAFLKVWSGGLTFYGGCLGALAGMIAYMRVQGLPVLDMLDFSAPFAAIAHMFGRLGCFGNGCCYGVPTDGSWGWVFHEWVDPERLPRHATQLYEAFGLCLIALILDRMWRRGLAGGRGIAAYLGLYALLRFGIETFRGDTAAESYLLGTSLAQTTAMGLLVVAGVIWSRRRPLPRPPVSTWLPEEDEGAGG